MTYVRPITARYLDPVDLVWTTTAKRLGLTLRRDPTIYSMTDGTGLLALGPRSDLDEDDCVAQMILHELCHWIVNGLESFSERDWGFPLDLEVCWREHACLRLQAWLSDRYGLRAMFGPTGFHRPYWDRLPADVLEPLDDSEWEAKVVAHTAVCIERAQGDPWFAPLDAAFRATRAIAETLQPFMPDYATEHDGDTLPSLWDLARD